MLSFASTYFGTTEIFDLSVNFQTAQRILSGQRLYQDFYIPNGPIAALVLLPFAWIFPPGWALLLSSGALGASATLGMGYFLRREGVASLPTLCASVLTAVWFLPPMGAFYHDHLAYLWILLSLNNPLAPFLWALSVHTKITVGLPCAVILWLSSLRGRRHVKEIASKGLEFIGWLVLLGILWSFLFGWKGYYRATIELPSAYFGPLPQGFIRMAGRWFETIVIPFRIHPLQMLLEGGSGRLLFYPIVLCVYGVYYVLLKQRPGFKLARLLVLSSLTGGAFLGRSFTHLFFGLGGAIVISFPKRIIPITIFLCLSGILFTFQGRGFLTPKTAAVRSTLLSPLSAVDNVRTRSLVSILEQMHRKPGSYYLTDNEASLLPLALGIAPKNGCLDYHDGTGIPTVPEERLRWQRARIEELGRHSVRYIVRGPRDRYRYIDEYLRANYRLKANTGYFTLWEAVTARAAP